MNNVINNFKGNYYFLSNFYEAPVTYQGITYQNNEAAFQAQKCTTDKQKLEFANVNPSEAKHLGRKVNLRKDWEQIKRQYMYEIVRAKFDQNPELKNKLLKTGEVQLIEGNTWGDRIWGCTKSANGEWVGSNMLGNILMEIREEYVKENTDREERE